MNAIHYKVREDSKIKNKAVYVILGVNKDSFKHILGLWISKSKISNFRHLILIDKKRGVKDILIFSVGGLQGFKESISSSYYESVVQRCIIHQLRNTFKYVSYKDYKELMKDFKSVYKAVNESEGLSALYVMEEIRTTMYTTNIIEGVNRQFRKVTKTKSTLLSDECLVKIIYSASQNIMKKCTMRYRNWDSIIKYPSYKYLTNY